MILLNIFMIKRKSSAHPIDQLVDDTELLPEGIPRAMDDRQGRREGGNAQKLPELSRPDDDDDDDIFKLYTFITKITQRFSILFGWQECVGVAILQTTLRSSLSGIPCFCTRIMWIVHWHMLPLKHSIFNFSDY